MALETAAAIIGILAAAGKVVEILGPVVSTYTKATKNAAAALSEVNQMQIILFALHAYLDDLSKSPSHRRELIQIDQLAATFTDGVLLFSELEELAVGLRGAPEDTMGRLRWARNDGKFASVKSRMQPFKASITIMLNILQCESDQEAYRSRSQLLANTSVLLTSNAELAQRLARLETRFQTATSVPTNRPESLMSLDTITRYNANTQMETIAEDDPSAILTDLANSQYERVLELSRVYRKATNFDTDASYRSSVVRSHAWTTLTDISLSDISAISVIALPIQATDITNMEHYAFSAAMIDTDDVATVRESDTLRNLDPHPRVIPGRLPQYDPMLKAADQEGSDHWTLLIHGTKESGAKSLISQCTKIVPAGTHTTATETSYVRNILVDDTQATLYIQVLEFADTPGGLRDMEEETAKQSMRRGDMMMLVYSTQSRTSFECLLSKAYTRLATTESYVRSTPVAVVANHHYHVGVTYPGVVDDGRKLALAFNAEHYDVITTGADVMDPILEDLIRKMRGSSGPHKGANPPYHYYT